MAGPSDIVGLTAASGGELATTSFLELQAAAGVTTRKITVANLAAILNLGSLAGVFSTTGVFTLNLTVGANTSVTLPTTGTLAILGANTFTGIQTLAAGTKAAPSLTLTGWGSTTGFYGRAGGSITAADASKEFFQINSSSAGANEGLSVTNRIALGAAASDLSTTAIDTILSRGAVGIFKFASAESFTANSTTATTMTSLGPAGANTTIQEWLTIKNASGTTRYIPCY